MSPLQAAALMLPIMVVQDMVSVWSYRKAWDRPLVADNARRLRLLGIAFGWLIAAYVSEAVVRVVVGIIAVVFVLLWWKRRGDLAGRAGRRAVHDAEQPLLGRGRPATRASSPMPAGRPSRSHVMPMRLSPERYAGTNTMFFAATNLDQGDPLRGAGPDHRPRR